MSGKSERKERNKEASRRCEQNGRAKGTNERGVRKERAEGVSGIARGRGEREVRGKETRECDEEKRN